MAESAAEKLKQEMEADLRAAETERASFLSKLEETAATSRAASGETEAVARPALRGEPPALTVIRDTTQPASTRLEVIQHLGLDIAGFDETVEALLAIVEDTEDDTGVRLGALWAVGSAAFQVVRFRPYQQAYQQALRNLVGDPDARLRDTSVSILARRHDRDLQQVLLEGLEGGGPLPVDRERAIQLLAEDDHLDNLPWLRELYASKSDDARQEAVRLMGSYPEAVDTLEATLRDKSEASAVRRQSAVSLRNLAPERFEAAAKEIAADATDDADVRATSTQALEHLSAGELPA